MARRLKPVDSNIIEEARTLVHTSVDDCKSSLYQRTDPAVIETAIGMAETLGHKSRLVLLRRRLKQIKRDTNICIFCECTDENACCAFGHEPCSWYLLDEKLKKGVCTYCADVIRHFAYCASGFRGMKMVVEQKDENRLGSLVRDLEWFSNLSGKLPRK